MRILAAIPTSPNLFPSPPTPPRINEPLPSPPPPPLNPKKTPKPPPPPPAFRLLHNSSHYTKPVPSSPDNNNTTARSVRIGESGVSYLLPNSPFPFQFSYSETPKTRPVALREPLHLPFAPPGTPRPWTGKSPLLSKKQKELKKKIRLFQPLGEDEGPPSKVLQIAGRMPEDFGRYADGRTREEVLGEALTGAEKARLVEPYLSCNRQVNLGRDGLTHNMLELVHSHWRRQEVCKVRCRGVPTVDMNNVCRHLEVRLFSCDGYRREDLHTYRSVWSTGVRT